MPLSKQRKAQLDAYTLEFNKWATKVLTIVYDKYPGAHVTMKQLMSFYVMDVYYLTAATHFIQKHRTRTGG
jgi:hypothetical protein